MTPSKIMSLRENGLMFSLKYKILQAILYDCLLAVHSGKVKNRLLELLMPNLLEMAEVFIVIENMLAAYSFFNV